jgi:hypothetical protein
MSVAIDVATTLTGLGKSSDERSGMAEIPKHNTVAYHNATSKYFHVK